MADYILISKQCREDLIVSRVFDAPKELVWRMWSEPEQVRTWWGPKNYASPFVKIDFQVNGKYFYCMRSPEGKDYWNIGTYKEIVPLEKIVSVQSFADANGNIVEPKYYGERFIDFPIELSETVSFEDLGVRTMMTLRHASLPGNMTELTRQGWEESFDKMAETLKEHLTNTVLIAEPGAQEATIIRLFDAPKELVFEAYSNPNLISQWWGPENLSTTVEKLDFKQGGVWQYVQSDSAGKKFVFSGVFNEIIPNEKIVRTFEFDGMPGHILLESIAFLEINGKTLVMDKTVFKSEADRESMLNSGMREGAPVIMCRLAEVLEKQKTKQEYTPYGKN